MSSKLKDFEIFPNNKILKYGKLVHMALFVNYELIQFEEAIKSKTQVITIKEELSVINRNNT